MDGRMRYVHHPTWVDQFNIGLVNLVILSLEVNALVISKFRPLPVAFR